MNNLPNIILIVLDNVGAKHMSLYNYNRNNTPHINQIAKNSTTYNRCYAPGCWTLPSHASLFTGLYPCEHGIESFDQKLSSNFNHLASILKQSGYYTFGISCNPIVVPQTSLCIDYDFFKEETGRVKWKHSTINNNNFSHIKNNDMHHILNSSNNIISNAFNIFNYIKKYKDFSILLRSLQNRIDNILLNKRFKNTAHGTRRSFRLAMEIIKNHQRSSDNNPFFLFMNVMEAHYWFNPPRYKRKFSRPQDKQELLPYKLYDPVYESQRDHLLPIWKNLYDDEIYFLDQEVGRFYSWLNASNILDNTIFIILSDHGEHFGEKGYYEHRFSLHNELIWVPLIIKFPHGTIKPGNDNRLVSLIDIFSTLLDMTNCPIPPPRNSYSLLSSELRKSVSSMILKTNPLKRLLARNLNRPIEWAETIPSHQYALILDNNIKIIEKNDGQVEIYAVDEVSGKEDPVDSLPPDLKKEFVELLAADKKVTGYC